MQDYFSTHLSLVYLIYASSFLLLGFAIHLQAEKNHFLKINMHLYWAKYFALLHAGKEFADWYKVTYTAIAWLEFIGNLFLILSFVALMEFGRRILYDIFEHHNRVPEFIKKYLTLILTLSAIVIGFANQDAPHGFSVACRYFIGFPASFLAAAAMLLGIRHDAKMKGSDLSFPVKLVAISFVAYGILGGLIVHDNDVFPVLLSMENFKQLTGLPVQLFRATAAFGLLIGFGNIIKTVNNALKKELDTTISHFSEQSRVLQTEIGEHLMTQSQLQESLQATEHANQVKSEFLANMSHEIRTPINGIINLAKLSLNEADTQKRHYYLSQVVDSSELLLNIIADILDFSKIESNQLDIKKRRFDLIDSLDFIEGLFSLKAEEKGIESRFIKDANLPGFLIGDDLRLKQILINLMSNAVKFTEKGSVTLHSQLIACSETGHALLRFSVTDTGIGIAKEKLPGLFDAFIQAEDATTRQFGGSGLGLAISQNLAKLLGGKLSAKSEPGKGSCFSLQLPFEIAKADLDKPEDIDPESPVDLSGKKLLVVEDNKTNRLVMKVILEQENIGFDMAHNGLEALERLENNSYDAVLMDIQMPVMNGRDATKKIRNSNKPYQNIPIIAMTAYAVKGDRERCLDAGMNAYIPKPIDRNKFVAALSKELAS